MFHDCDSDCKEYKDKDYFFDKWEINGIKYKRCPLIYVTEDVSFWIKAYQMYKNGYLLNNGGWASHSNKYIEIMIFIDNQMNKYQNEVNKNG